MLGAMVMVTLRSNLAAGVVTIVIGVVMAVFGVDGLLVKGSLASDARSLCKGADLHQHPCSAAARQAASLTALPQ